MIGRHFHCAVCTVAGRRGNVISVAAHAVADNFGINLRAAGFGMLIFFQHQSTRALAHDKTAAGLVPRTGSLFRAIVEIGGNRLHPGKTGQPQNIDRGFRTAGQHQVGIAADNQRRRVADGVGTGRTGGNAGVVGAFQTETDRQVAGDHIDQTGRNKERGNPVSALVFVDDDGVFVNCLQTADSRSHHHAGAILFFLAFRFPAAVFHGINAGGHPEENKLVNPALFLRFHHRIRVKPVRFFAHRHLAGNFDRHVIQFKIFINSSDCRLSGNNVFPVIVNASAKGSQHSHSGYNYSSHRISLKLNWYFS